MQAGCQPKNLDRACAVGSGHNVLKKLLFGMACLGCWQEVLELHCQLYSWVIGRPSTEIADCPWECIRHRLGRISAKDDSV